MSQAARDVSLASWQRETRSACLPGDNYLGRAKGVDAGQQPLLERKDLGEQAPQAMERALGWLENFQQALEARFVLQPLLQRTDLGGHKLRLIQLAMIWLSRFHQTYGAGFVLEALMGLADWGKQADQVFDFSLAWLEIFHQKKSAQFLFRAC